MKIAALVKQVPSIGDVALDADGRLARDESRGELNPQCRRAISKGVELARATGGTCTVITLGPPPARRVLVEALDFGGDDALLVCDPAFAGSDTLATAKALAAALRLTGPYDLLLAGQASVDSGTAQVGAQVAQLLGLPFLDGVRELEVADGTATARCERDDGWRRARVALPAVLTCAERLCDPAKRPNATETDQIGERIRVVTADELGAGPWGQAGSPTRVGAVRRTETARLARVVDTTLDTQVDDLLALLAAHPDRATDDAARTVTAPPPDVATGPDLPVAVLAEPRRDVLTRQLLGGARQLTAGQVTLLTVDDSIAPGAAHEWGADAVVRIRGGHARHAAPAAIGVTAWLDENGPPVLLAPGTTWGREVAARVSVAFDAGVVGDAIGLRIEDGSLVCDKPVADGHTVAAIHVDSALKIATVRPGVLRPVPPRPALEVPVHEQRVADADLVEHLDEFVDETIDELVRASVVLGVGAGVALEDYPLVDEFARAIGAQLAATRKVTDRGWHPHSRQVGVTGLSITPDVYLAIGISGKNYHAVGVRAAKTIIAVNSDPEAPIFRLADLGLIADWRDVARAALARHRAGVAALPMASAG